MLGESYSSILHEIFEFLHNCKSSKITWPNLLKKKNATSKMLRPIVIGSRGNKRKLDVSSIRIRGPLSN